jgi:hypothetical protein
MLSHPSQRRTRRNTIPHYTPLPSGTIGIKLSPPIPVSTEKPQDTPDASPHDKSLNTTQTTPTHLHHHRQTLKRTRRLIQTPLPYAPTSHEQQPVPHQHTHQLRIQLTQHTPHIPTATLVYTKTTLPHPKQHLPPHTRQHPRRTRQQQLFRHIRYQHHPRCQPQRPRRRLPVLFTRIPIQPLTRTMSARLRPATCVQSVSVGQELLAASKPILWAKGLPVSLRWRWTKPVFRARVLALCWRTCRRAFSIGAVRLVV